jgi:hypothetical protein
MTETAPIVVTTSSVPAPALQIQTASLSRLSTEGQPDSSESKEDTSQFVITPRSSAPDTTAFVPRRILSFVFLAFDAKGGERVDSGGVLIEGFVFSLCATFMHHVYLLALLFVTVCL